MVMLLRLNSLLEIVTGEIQEPPKGHDLRFDWERLCLIASMAILNNVSFSINEKMNKLVIYPSTAWTRLEMLCSIPDAQVAQEGSSKAMSIRISACSSVTDYTGKIEAAWEDVFAG
jgi:hypothetical protein